MVFSVFGGTIFAYTLPSMFDDAGVPDCSLNERPTKQVMLMFNESKLQKKTYNIPQICTILQLERLQFKHLLYINLCVYIYIQYIILKALDWMFLTKLDIRDPEFRFIIWPQDFARLEFI